MASGFPGIQGFQDLQGVIFNLLKAHVYQQYFSTPITKKMRIDAQFMLFCRNRRQ
jgi:hypothetical protein